MGKKVINNEKCWCVNASGCKDPTVGEVFDHNKEKYESIKEDRKFKEMIREKYSILYSSSKMIYQSLLILKITKEEISSLIKGDKND